MALAVPSFADLSVVPNQFNAPVTPRWSIPETLRPTSNISTAVVGDPTGLRAALLKANAETELPCKSFWCREQGYSTLDRKPVFLLSPSEQLETELPDKVREDLLRKIFILSESGGGIGRSRASRVIYLPNGQRRGGGPGGGFHHDARNVTEQTFIAIGNRPEMTQFKIGPTGQILHNTPDYIPDRDDFSSGLIRIDVVDDRVSRGGAGFAQHDGVEPPIDMEGAQDVSVPSVDRPAAIVVNVRYQTKPRWPFPNDKDRSLQLLRNKEYDAKYAPVTRLPALIAEIAELPWTDGGATKSIGPQRAFNLVFSARVQGHFVLDDKLALSNDTLAAAASAASSILEKARVPASGVDIKRVKELLGAHTIYTPTMLAAKHASIEPSVDSALKSVFETNDIRFPKNTIKRQRLWYWTMLINLEDDGYNFEAATAQGIAVPPNTGDSVFNTFCTEDQRKIIEAITELNSLEPPPSVVDESTLLSILCPEQAPDEDLTWGDDEDW